MVEDGAAGGNEPADTRARVLGDGWVVHADATLRVSAITAMRVTPVGDNWSLNAIAGRDGFFALGVYESEDEAWDMVERIKAGERRTGPDRT